MNKYQKIELVRLMGFNTEDNILVSLWEQYDQDKFNNFVIAHNISDVSIRTMATTQTKDKKTPHFPLIDINGAKEIIPRMLNDHFICIVATPIDPKDAMIAGAAVKSEKKNSIVFDIACGPGTVRRVTHEGIIDIFCEYNQEHKVAMIKGNKGVSKTFVEIVTSTINEVAKIPIKNCSIEFSYYNHPVGYKKENIIIWDIDGDGSSESIEEIEDTYDKLMGD